MERFRLVSARLTINPRTPTAVRIHPTRVRSIPRTLTLTARARIRPSAIKPMLDPILINTYVPVAATAYTSALYWRVSRMTELVGILTAPGKFLGPRDMQVGHIEMTLIYPPGARMRLLA
jgi:hypothetical protein